VFWGGLVGFFLAIFESLLHRFLEKIGFFSGDSRIAPTSCFGENGVFFWRFSNRPYIVFWGGLVGFFLAIFESPLHRFLEKMVFFLAIFESPLHRVLGSNCRVGIATSVISC
jgi:hypothetical protein